MTQIILQHFVTSMLDNCIVKNNRDNLRLDCTFLPRVFSASYTKLEQKKMVQAL